MLALLATEYLAETLGGANHSRVPDRKLGSFPEGVTSHERRNCPRVSVESAENLDLLDRELIHLEKDPRNDTLASVFRTIHTIKGTCGFLGFTKLESVAHVGENLLSKLRDLELALSPAITTALLQMVDAVRQMLASVEAIGNEGDRNDQELIKTLTHLQQGSATAKIERTHLAVEPLQAAGRTTNLQQKAEVPEKPVPTSPDKPAGGSATAAPRMETKPDIPEAAAERSEAGPPATSEVAPQQTRGSASESSIDVVLLDKLMTLVGELVLARNQILQFSNGKEDVGLIAPSQRLNLITTELQEGVMKTRMQPIGNIWSKLPRPVRDVATMCGKQVRIEMEGKTSGMPHPITP
jgi:two-component system, chemotaxis family, sensor kinase CheA